jgi:hypothetical protein
MSKFSFICLMLISPLLQAAPLSEYLPADVEYDLTIPTPSSVLGHEVGEWHARHDQLVTYLQVLADASPRIKIEVIGKTHEKRSQLLLSITSPDNHDQLDSLRQRHLDYSTGKGDQPGPLVLWFGYSIHGNEASGSNAALLMAYHLVAMQGAAAEQILGNTIILIDPSLNPDGMGRFAHWVNSNRSLNLVADRNNREHQETWPGGRFNHYWFDLNRDWLLLTHPESRARVAVLQHWQPNVVTDFHEMGPDSTYFFQPGVADRTNPLTPAENQQLTAKLAEYHARALDEAGQLYFSAEQFDDYYYGKGSTYPDIQGMIGILFEQASARGHLMATDHGDRSFAQAVANHLTTSLSTLKGATENARELQEFQRRFHLEAEEEARRDSVAAYLFGDRLDPARGRAMAEVLVQHDIEVLELTKSQQSDGVQYEPGSAWLIPTRQRQYRLIKSLMMRHDEFRDTTFYDVSTWTFPLAFDLPVSELGRLGDLAGGPYQRLTEAGQNSLPSARAYAIEWHHYFAPQTLQSLLSEGFKAQVATKPFTASVGGGSRDFERGTIVLAAGPDADYRNKLMARLKTVADHGQVPVIAINSGLTPGGVDLGSPSMRSLEPIKPLLLIGPGISGTEVGEVWHLMDRRIGLAPVMIDAQRLARINLDDYTHLLMVNGSYDSIEEKTLERVTQWIQGGGILVASKRAADWATSKKLHQGGKKDETKKKPDDEEPAVAPRAYGDHSKDYSKTVIGGAIVNASVDVTHPLAYGYSRPELALFRNGTTFLKPSENPYETYLRYTDDPLLSGYMGEARQQQLSGSAAASANRVGRGTVIRLADNPNFRGFWYGTNRLYFNALYLAQILDRTPVPDTETLK